MTKILYGDVGDSENPHSSSGSGYPCYKSLQKYADVCGSIDASFNIVQKLWNALMTFDIDSTKWRERRHKSIGTFHRHTRCAERRALKYDDQYEFYLQQRALSSPARWCEWGYGIYTDATHHNTMESWAEWSPFSADELEQWLYEEQFIYDHADLLFPRSKYVADSMINDYNQDPAKVHIVGGGINFEEEPEKHGVYDGKTILFIGYDFKRKGGYELLDAFSKVRESIPDARLIIAGPEKLTPVDGVELLGKLKDRDVISDLYKRSSLFVMPSHFEPWGNVYLEAMANGVPCIASNWAAAPEIINHGHDGWLVERGNVDELASVIISALSSVDTLATFGDRARTKVLQHFTWDNVVKKMVDIIDATRVRYD